MSAPFASGRRLRFSCPHATIALVLGAVGTVAGAGQIELLSASNAEQLRSVFFSGNPWLVQCASKADLKAAAADASLGAHEVVETATLAASFPKDMRVGLIDCLSKLPSGKSIKDRFSIDTSQSPSIVLFANANPPLQVTPKLLGESAPPTLLFPTMRQHATALNSMLRSKSEAKAYILTQTSQLQQHCLKRKQCVLFISPREITNDASRLLGSLLTDFRAVSFGTVNAARYDLSLARHLPAPVDPKKPQVLAFHTESAGKGKLRIKAKAHRGAFALKEIQSFIKQLQQNELEMTPLKKIPTLTWRKQESKSKENSSSKKEKEEPKRRRGGGGGGSGGGGGGGGSDSREGGSSKKARAPEKGEMSKAERAAAEARRRRAMAEEEEQLLESMFETDGEGEDEGEGEEEEEDEIDFDGELDGEGDEDGEDGEGDDPDDDAAEESSRVRASVGGQGEVEEEDEDELDFDN